MVSACQGAASTYTGCSTPPFLALARTNWRCPSYIECSSFVYGVQLQPTCKTWQRVIGSGTRHGPRSGSPSCTPTRSRTRMEGGRVMRAITRARSTSRPIGSRLPKCQRVSGSGTCLGMPLEAHHKMLTHHSTLLWNGSCVMKAAAFAVPTGSICSLIMPRVEEGLLHGMIILRLDVCAHLFTVVRLHQAAEQPFR